MLTCSVSLCVFVILIYDFVLFWFFFFFFKQKTAYEMRISDWSSDVCSSDLLAKQLGRAPANETLNRIDAVPGFLDRAKCDVEQHIVPVEVGEIGRASCRERVCQYV